MLIQFSRKDSVFPLAWAASHNKGSDIIDVVAGPRVSSQEGIFWEGVNTCPDDPGKIASHHFSIVTGGLTDNDSGVFFTPGHVLDRLFFTTIGQSFHISNSLPFLLARSTNTLIPDYLHYDHHLRTMVENVQFMPACCAPIGILNRANIRLGRDNTINIEQKDEPPSFNSFDSYVEATQHWLRQLQTALQNGANARYRLLTTISSGYDSPAVSVLAKHIGVNEAITIDDSRQGGPGSTDDSGAEIAERLGMRVSRISRNDYQRYGLPAELVFNFAGSPDDLPFYTFKDQLCGTVLFNGVHGDTIWNRVTADRQWRHIGAAGASMQEFRLRAAFVQVPLPFFGCDAQRVISKISQSQEMEPWTLWNDYDRPIPRRIVEEAGIPRELFGMQKMAVTVAMGIDGANYLKPKDFHTSDAFLQELANHMKAQQSVGFWLKMLYANAIHLSIQKGYKLFHALKARAKKRKVDTSRRTHQQTLKAKYDRQGRFRWKYIRPFNEHTFSTQVANSHMTREYLEAMKTEVEEQSVRVKAA